jgi:hypothetical protein
VRYAPSIQVICLLMLPMAGCNCSGLRFWRGTSNECEQTAPCGSCGPCDNQLSRTNTVTLGHAPIVGQPTMIDQSTIEYADPQVMPDNFRAVEPKMDSVPSNPDLENVPIPVPDPAT